MVNSTSAIPIFVSQIDVAARISNRDPRAIVNSFYSEMQKIMGDYANPDATLELNGLSFVGDEKNTVQCQTFLNKFLTDNSNATETILNICNMLVKLEETAGKM